MPIYKKHDALTGRVSLPAYQSGSRDHRSSNSRDPHTGGCWLDSLMWWYGQWLECVLVVIGRRCSPQSNDTFLCHSPTHSQYADESCVCARHPPSYNIFYCSITNLQIPSKKIYLNVIPYSVKKQAKLQPICIQQKNCNKHTLIHMENNDYIR